MEHFIARQLCLLHRQLLSGLENIHATMKERQYLVGCFRFAMKGIAAARADVLPPGQECVVALISANPKSREMIELIGRLSLLSS